MKWIRRLFSFFGILSLPAVFAISGVLLACIGVMICVFTKAQSGGSHPFLIALALLIPSLFIGVFMLVIAMRKEECRPHDAEPMQKEQVQAERKEEAEARKEKSDEKHGEDHGEKHSESKGKSSWLRIFFGFAFITAVILILVYFLSPTFAAYARSLGEEVGINNPQQSAVRFGGNWCDTNKWDYLHRNVSKVVIHPTMGCYAGNVRLPPNWGQVKIEKSQNPGSEMRIWCAGKSRPSRTYFGYEQDFEQTDIDSCYLNGRDTSMTFRVQGTPGSSITIRPVTLIQGVPMPPPEKETDN